MPKRSVIPSKEGIQSGRLCLSAAKKVGIQGFSGPFLILQKKTKSQVHKFQTIFNNQYSKRKIFYLEFEYYSLSIICDLMLEAWDLFFFYPMIPLNFQRAKVLQEDKNHDEEEKHDVI